MKLFFALFIFMHALIMYKNLEFCKVNLKIFSNLL